MNKFIFITLMMCMTGSLSCGSGGDDPVPPDPDPEEPDKRPTNLEEYNQVSEGLKDYYTPADYFLMGVALEPSALDDAAQVSLIKRHFNSITAENVMKWSSLQPTEGTFRFENADKLVSFAQANGMKVRGHTLCWHQQVPDWVFLDNGVTAGKEKVLERLRTHIAAVVTHFKGKVYAWDVVNEVIDDGNEFYKSTKWYDICGKDFIIEAFKAARQADPDALLFYNDYSATQPAKRDKIYQLLQELKSQDLVGGMGLQGHWNVDAPSNELIIDALNKYRSLGIDIQITEMDVSVYPNNSDPEVAWSATLESKQAITYSRFFALFRTYKNDIGSVTFWGLTDSHSWLNNWPVTGRDNYPLLFDRDGNPKKAYFSVIDF